MKLSLFIAFAFYALMAASCKKQYTCECKHEIYENHDLSNTSTEVKYIKASKKSSAAGTCVSNNSEAISFDGYGHRTICGIKD